MSLICTNNSTFVFYSTLYCDTVPRYCSDTWSQGFLATSTPEDLNILNLHLRRKVLVLEPHQESDQQVLVTAGAGGDMEFEWDFMTGVTCFLAKIKDGKLWLEWWVGSNHIFRLWDHQSASIHGEFHGIATQKAKTSKSEIQWLRGRFKQETGRSSGHQTDQTGPEIWWFPIFRHRNMAGSFGRGSSPQTSWQP